MLALLRNRTRFTLCKLSPFLQRSFKADLSSGNDSTEFFYTGIKKHDQGALDTFPKRHIGPRPHEVSHMLQQLKLTSLDELIDKTIPKNIHSRVLNIGKGLSESQALQKLQKLMAQNKVYKSFIGAGYYDTITPPVILRNILENPGWYTPYTPYQAEISQGRLEMLLNFQTMISDLTMLPVSNASLLDEATAAAEAALMCYSLSNKKRNVFLVADDCHPQTISVVKTRLECLDIQVIVQSPDHFDFTSNTICGALVQYPNTFGAINDYSELAEKAHAHKSMIVAATDLLAITMLKPPGEWGADIAVGSAQRFGVPLGYGGPHAGFLATKDEFKRKIPGRLIGVSRDRSGKKALRMAMQTREQHIRRDRATSNICTAQALLANTAAAFGIYHGPNGLRDIAERVYGWTVIAKDALTELGFVCVNDSFFDTISVRLEGSNVDELMLICESNGCTIRKINADTVSFSIDETTTSENISALLGSFAQLKGKTFSSVAFRVPVSDLGQYKRTSDYLTHPIFNSHHSETDLMRYLFSLQSKDLSLQTSMIPLGSCTMKLNSASEMIPVTWSQVGNLHPFVPSAHAKGYEMMIKELGKDLANITGFDAISFQPNSGSQGEYAGLLCIRDFHIANGDDRDICLIPVSAHGTNPASAVLAGMKVVIVNCDEKGDIDLIDLESKAEKHKEQLAAFMVTYPSTHGVFESSIRESCEIIHRFGGQVYMDGANMNAQVGLCSPGDIGADVCHLNLHKTFCIPHGGGGPGMGPIGVKKHLEPFLPGHIHPTFEKGRESGAVAAAPFSSASILPISWMYIKMMGSHGLKLASEIAILNANYMAKRLEEHFDILYRGDEGYVAHEFIVDLRPFKKFGITEEDVAKRLMDYNFHGPTMSWPVAGTLMVEPTESEPLSELDRFCDAMIQIRKEIAQVEAGKVAPEDSVLQGAPHTAEMVISDTWEKSYSRETAAYPLPYLRNNKFWPSVGRIDNVFGDRNVVCTCPPITDYQ